MEPRISIPPFGALRAFEAYGRASGVRKTAELLGVSHTIISRHLRALEDWVGVPLIDRSSGKLTANGESYHRDISRSMRALARASTQFHPKADGHLRVTCIQGLASAWLAPRLGSFRRKHPQIELLIRPLDRITDCDRNDIATDIRYFRHEDLERLPDDLTVLEIVRSPMFPVASPDIAREVNRRITGAADLMKESLLEAEDSHEWHNFFLRHHVQSPSFRSYGRLGAASLTLAAARHGQGIALANVYLVHDDLVKGYLEPIFAPDIKYNEIVMGAYFLVASATNWRQPQFIAFRNWLLGEISTFNQQCSSSMQLRPDIYLSPQIITQRA